MDALTPTEAAGIAGVPAAQLARWAWIGQGPRNIGTQRKPLYLEADVRKWRLAHEEKNGAGASKTERGTMDNAA